MSTWKQMVLLIIAVSLPGCEGCTSRSVYCECTKNETLFTSDVGGCAEDVGNCEAVKQESITELIVESGCGANEITCDPCSEAFSLSCRTGVNTSLLPIPEKSLPSR